jgi:hypothetical protein
MSETELTTVDPASDTPPEPPRKQRIYPILDKTPFTVGEGLPNLMSCNELMRALNMNSATFDEAQREGKFKRFEHRNPMQRKKRYSGLLVTKYLSEPR